MGICETSAPIEDIERYEAERRLRLLPKELLASAWALESQVEAVVDAVLACTLRDPSARRRARHVGEWCACIARALPFGPTERDARRCGVLADIEPGVLERIRELRIYAPVVARLGRAGAFDDDTPSHNATVRIVAVALEFNTRAFPDVPTATYLPGNALREMLSSAGSNKRPYIQALIKGFHVRRPAPALANLI